MDASDIGLMDFDKLKPLQKKIIVKLGELGVRINYNKQSRFKFDQTAQANIVILTDMKKYYQKLKDSIDKRIRKGV